MRLPICLAILLSVSAAFATEPETRTLPSGVTMQIHREGPDGAPPARTDVVRVHYQGSLSDGTVFDSSYARGNPAELPLDRLISCWQEVLQQMTPGTLVHIVCPPETAYGRRGVRGRIPRDATLSFVIELIEVRH
ncbi:FKBP-type peptidyl-prolyl cis-trans isomerase [Azoarcus taiwanensis]|uniref:Peptidyl-prolyl cis-trans isomerase n=1 Tax=Azoarcus taiwanensis TaxID=666964 RepID=A0A972F5C7_9RHOO|nr:FKBP-type peptidyl-prolyl cis-trans isomerase [Azoarcus taiwanensis]NMG01489.1 FKBP-type peptidyl-prolyl cis-trans isomerase [Azoarcus taiwanensis]